MEFNRESFEKALKVNKIVRYQKYFEAVVKSYLETENEQCNIANVVKSLPNDEEVKAHIDTLPYYGTCTTEYNEGFEDGVKWLKEQLAK